MDKDIYDLIYKNKTAGLGEPQRFEMEFLKFDAAAIARNFKNSTFKGEDFFVHFEEIFYFDAQKSLRAGGTCAADGVNLSGAGEAINDEAINLDAKLGKNLTERASVNEISSDCGKISATTAGDKILTCANATQIVKKASVAPNTNRTNETDAKESVNLKQNCLGSNDVNLTGYVSANTAIDAKFSRTAPGEKRTLACEQIVTKQGAQINSVAAASDTLNANDLIATIDASNALNSSGADGVLATIDAMGAALCKNGLQAERQSKPSFTKQQDKRQSELSCAEPQDVLILLSLGAFDFPQQCFIRANASGTRYFIRRPLPTRENHAAHQKISEIFSQWQR